MTGPVRNDQGETPSPVDPGHAVDARDARGWAAGTIMMASLLLLLVNAQALNDWAAEQTPSATMVHVTGATEGWLAATQRIGTAGPRRWLHGLWTRAQAMRFAGQDQAEGPPG